MKKIFGCVAGFILLAGVSAVSAVADEAAYYGEFEAFGLFKQLLDGGDNATSKGRAVGGPFPTDATIRDIDDATDGFGMGGGRLTIGRVLNERDSVEFTAMGFNHDSSSLVVDPDFRDIDAIFQGAVIGFLPLGLVADEEFTTAILQSVDNNTSLISGEINYRRQLSQMLSLLGGIRYVYFEDDLHFFSDVNAVVADVGRLNIYGENHLIGLQIGADVEVPVTDKFTVNGGFRLGGFLNIASLESHIFDDDGNSVRFADTETRGSAITEGKLGLSLKVAPNVTLSLGYMAMLLSWVTTAGENFPQADSAAEFQKHDSDHVLVHGPLARVTFILP